MQATEFGAAELSGLGVFIGRIAFIVIMFVAVAFAAYYTTKFIASSKRKSGNSSNIKIIEGVAVGSHANIQLVCVAGKYFLIGVTKESITFLTEITGDEVNAPEPAKIFVPFETYFNKVFNRKTDEQGGESDD